MKSCDNDLTTDNAVLFTKDYPTLNEHTVSKQDIYNTQTFQGRTSKTSSENKTIDTTSKENPNQQIKTTPMKTTKTSIITSSHKTKQPAKVT